MSEPPMPAVPGAPADAVFIRASSLWIGALVVGGGLFLMCTLIVLLARQLECLIFPVVILAMLGGVGFGLRSSAREVVVDATGILVRWPGGDVEASIPWAKVAEVRYVRVRQRHGEREQVDVRQSDRTVVSIADYQVRSIHQVARVIARFHPGDTTGGSPRFNPPSGWAALGRGTSG